MPSLQNIVLKDRTTPTPVDHTLTPRDKQGPVGIVAEPSGIPIGDTKLTVSMRKTSTGKYKPELRLSVPVVIDETINGVVRKRVSHVAYANIDFTFDPLSTEAERNNVVGMLADSLAPSKTLVNDTVVKLQGVFG